MAIVTWASTSRTSEREAGLAARCRMVMQAYGGRAAFAKRFNIPFTTVRSWKKIPYKVVPLIHKDNPQKFTSLFCRPDLKWKGAELVSSFRAGQKKRIYS